jgi:outer membrane protein TolC
MRTEALLLLILFTYTEICPRAHTASAVEQEINLSQAIDFALKQNREIRKTLLTLESSGLEIERANIEFKFNLTPKVSTEVTGNSSATSYGLDLSKKIIFGTQARVGVQSSESLFDDSPDIHRNSVVAEIRQPILRRIGRLVNEEPIVQAANNVKTARRYFEIQKTDLIVEVVSKHEELLMLQRQIEYELKAIERLTRLNRLTQVRQKQGRATRVDSLRSDLKLGNSQLNYNNTKERLQSLRADYAELLGFPALTEFKVMPSALVTVEITNLESAVSIALQKRLDYAQILQDCEDAKRGIKIARRNMLPDLSMISRYEINGQGISASEAKLDDNVWFVGLSLDSDVLLRNERLALSEALIRNQLSELKIEEVRAAINRKVQQEILSYNRTQKQIGLAERNYQAAQDRTKLARRLFEMHKGDSFSVTDAEDELSQSEIQLLSAQSEAATAAYKLKRVLGTLIEYPIDLEPPKEP